MAVDRSDKVYEYWRDAFLRFDYFVTGGTAALAAYVGQGLKPNRLGLNAGSLELLALLILVGSIAVGLKRIEEGVELFKKMHQRVYHEESRGALVSAALEGGISVNKSTGDTLKPPEALYLADLHKQRGEELEGELSDIANASLRYYKLRNRLLLFGFLFLIVARILPAYGR